MEEHSLQKIALLVSVMGLLLLLFVSDYVPAQTKEQSFLSSKTTVQGVVKSIQLREKVAFLTIEGQKTETMEVVVFAPESLYLQEGDYIEIIGTLEEYQGKKEVLAEKIILS